MFFFANDHNYDNNADTMKIKNKNYFLNISYNLIVIKIFLNNLHFLINNYVTHTHTHTHAYTHTHRILFENRSLLVEWTAHNK